MKTNRLALGAVVGAVAGIVAGVLTAPKSGEETRDDLKRRARELKEDALTKKDEVVQRAEDVKDRITKKR
jgi:gas vesicle protein